MTRTLALRIRQLTLAGMLVALLVPVAASTAQAAGTCSAPQLSFTFVTPIGTITTCESFTTIAPGISTARGTFIISAGAQPVATGELFAIHAGSCVLASFEGTTTSPVVLTPLLTLPAGQEFSGSLVFNCITTAPGAGLTIIHFEGIGTVTVGFSCGLTSTGYSCAPTGLPTFVPAGGRDD
jgi:hypothetical protein